MKALLGCPLCKIVGNVPLNGEILTLSDRLLVQYHCCSCALGLDFRPKKALAPHESRIHRLVCVCRAIGSWTACCVTATHLLPWTFMCQTSQLYSSRVSTSITFCVLSCSLAQHSRMYEISIKLLALVQLQLLGHLQHRR